MPATLGISEIVPLLVEFGRRTALAGGNPFRAKAYLRAAESLAAQAEPIERLIEDERLQEIPGVGDAIADIITKLAQTGNHPTLEKMRAEIPEGVLEMLTVPGLRPDKVIKIYKELGITTLDQLEAAAKEDRIREVKGLGLALQRKIIQGLVIRRDTRGARHVHRAEELIANASDSLKRSGLSFSKIVPAGDFRRGTSWSCTSRWLPRRSRWRTVPSGSRTASSPSFSPTRSGLASACCWQPDRSCTFAIWNRSRKRRASRYQRRDFSKATKSSQQKLRRKFIRRSAFSLPARAPRGPR